MVQKLWSRIEVGYEMDELDRRLEESLLAAHLQILRLEANSVRAQLCAKFSAERRLAWALGGKTDLSAPATGHDWVAQVLTFELNLALPTTATTKFNIETKHLLCTKPCPSVRPAEVDKPHGTQCRLVGDRWFNYRSYQIEPTTIGLTISKNALLMATLVWPCDDVECDMDAIVAKWHADRAQ